MRYSLAFIRMPRLRRDSERIARRLAIRENGHCVLGFMELARLQAALH
jgi:hypothetical protein